MSQPDAGNFEGICVDDTGSYPNVDRHAGTASRVVIAQPPLIKVSNSSRPSRVTASSSPFASAHFDALADAAIEREAAAGRLRCVEATLVSSRALSTRGALARFDSGRARDVASTRRGSRVAAAARCVGATGEGHDHAVVVLVELPRIPERDNLAYSWTLLAARGAAELRATEVAVTLARHIRAMGFAARADVPGHVRLDHARLAVLAGLALRSGERLTNPFVGEAFALAHPDLVHSMQRAAAAGCHSPLGAVNSQ